MSDAGEVCPTCGCRGYGCTVLEVGAFCRGPRRRLPPAASPARYSSRTGGPRWGIVVFAVPPAAPIVACSRCGLGVVWVPLPTGGRLAVDAASREAHDATCTGLRSLR